MNSSLVFTLNDLNTRNAFNVERLNQLVDAARDLRAESTDALVPFLVVQSRGPVFVSGGLLTDHIGPRTRTLKTQEQIRRTLQKLHALPLFKVALVEGDVLGGGLEFLSIFDCVIARPHVVFEWRQADMGLSYGWGGSARLDRRLGAHQTVLRAAQSALISAFEAKDIGLVDQIRTDTFQDADAIRQCVFGKKHLSLGSYLALKSASNPRAEATGFAKLWNSERHLYQLKRFFAR